MPMPPRLRRSVRQENAIARELSSGRRVVGSGNQQGYKGDVKDAKYLIEAKMTQGQSYSLKLATWHKIEGEAIRARKEPTLIIEIAGRKLAIIDYDHWLALKDE